MRDFSLFQNSPKPQIEQSKSKVPPLLRKGQSTQSSASLKLLKLFLNKEPRLSFLTSPLRASFWSRSSPILPSGRQSPLASSGTRPIPHPKMYTPPAASYRKQRKNSPILFTIPLPFAPMRAAPSPTRDPSTGQ